MTEEQRYLLDLWGYIHIRNAFSGKELSNALSAAERFVNSKPEELPLGFGIEGKRHLNGFAFDKSLERLATHPTIWPIIREVTKGRPRLTSGTLQINNPRELKDALPLHCAKDDYGRDAMRWDVRYGRVFCIQICALRNDRKYRID